MNALNRVLPIEDNPGDARMVTEYLRESYGDACALQEASTLSAGLKPLGATPYDVVLLDLGLPDSHELDTFSGVTSTVPGTPVPTPAPRQRLHRTGVRCHLAARVRAAGAEQDRRASRRL